MDQTWRYRRQAILRWKGKKRKAVECAANGPCETSNSRHTRSTTRTNNRLNSSVETSKSRKGRPTSKRGRELLKLIPFVADTLPHVSDCVHCGAVKFYSETDYFCCSDGRVVLSNNELSVVMKDLLCSMSEEAKLFRTYVRSYNNMFSFTSLGVTADKRLCKRNKGIYTFRVQGQVYHFINDLMPKKNNSKILLLYFHDTENEIENRLLACPRLSAHVIEKCVKYLEQNPYARFFRSLKDIPDLDDYKIMLKTVPGQDQRVYNKPEVSQVAAIWIDGEQNEEHGPRNIEVKTHDNECRSVQYYFGCYDPLQYPLMFPFGELGWHQGILKVNHSEKGKRGRIVSATEKLISPHSFLTAEDLLNMEENVMGKYSENSKFVSVREYYAYKLQMRQHDKSCLLYFGRLLQQYIVDNYVKLETQRLAFYKTQQEELRQEFLQGVVDAMASGETDASTIGQRVVLPADFIGGPRNMRRKYIDAMTLVQKFGKPDIFLTITCNPNWPEIKEHLMRHEEPQNRADLIVRVFHAKLEQLKHEIFKNNIFGDVAAHTYVIEFQKRGLPHAHFLLILKSHSKMYTPEEYDEIVSAEIPDENSNPHLFNMVIKHMFHGPCANLNQQSVCMKNNVCKNSYPKAFCDETSLTNDAYPTYRRRNNGCKVRVRGAMLDNRWVIPYNPYLLYKFTQDLNLTYVQFPDHFVWKADKRVWSPRILGDSVGRIVIAHPSEGERYYLRVLLMKVRCLKSFSDLKVCNGVRVPTFREAALLRGYLTDNNTQKVCLEEASNFHMPYELRRLFATLLVFTSPNNPRNLWLLFEDVMLEDLVMYNKYTRREAQKHAFQQINSFLQSMGRQLSEFNVLPKNFPVNDLEDETREIRAEKRIIVSADDLAAISNLNEKQKIAFDTIIERVNSNQSGAFFIDGPGGTGKTYLYRALLAKIRSEGNIALATATSGIAASLLPGGRTAHSRFNIPLDLSEGAICRISKQCSLATLIKSSKLIIWDEAPMARRTLIEALDDLLQDLMDSKVVFGGKVVVLGGDFRQTLPVVSKANKSEAIATCLTNSPIWPLLCQLQLQQNMRAHLDPLFTEFLLRVGDGIENIDNDDLLTLPTSMLIQTNSEMDNLNALMEYVYPDIYGNSTNIPVPISIELY